MEPTFMCPVRKRKRKRKRKRTERDGEILCVIILKAAKCYNNSQET
jgi:hypothetical protein